MFKIPVAVILGNPRVDCARLGICSLEESEPDPVLTNAAHHRHALALLSRSGPQEIQLDFLSEGLQPLTRKMFFSTDDFVVEAPKRINDALCQRLNIPPGCTLQPGLWPLNETDTGISIRIAFEYVPVVHTAEWEDPHLCCSG